MTAIAMMAAINTARPAMRKKAGVNQLVFTALQQRIIALQHIWVIVYFINHENIIMIL
jgi:hypothetical protein